MKLSLASILPVFLFGISLAITGCGSGGSGDVKATQQDELKAFLEANPEAKDVEMTP